MIGVKKNPQSPLYTSLGVITKGTIIEVNCSDLGLVTPSGKVATNTSPNSNPRPSASPSPTTIPTPYPEQVVWGKYAQVTNNPENDGCINAVLLV